MLSNQWPLRGPWRNRPVPAVLLLAAGRAVAVLALHIPQLQAGLAATVVGDSILLLLTQRLVLAEQVAAALAELAAVATLVVVLILLLAGALVLAVAQAEAGPEPDTPAALGWLVLAEWLVHRLVVAAEQLLLLTCAELVPWLGALALDCGTPVPLLRHPAARVPRLVLVLLLAGQLLPLPLLVLVSAMLALLVHSSHHS